MPIQPETIRIEPAETGRLDQFLAKRFPQISRAYLQQMIANKRVLVEGKVAKKGQNLQVGDEVQILGFERPEERQIRPNHEEDLEVAFDEEGVVAIEKAADLPTHPNDFEDIRTVANLAIARFPEMTSVGDEALRPGIVHRLDTDTSGLLLLARSEEAFRSLRSQFDERKISKRYLALVMGRVEKSGVIDTPVAHHATNPRKMVVVESGTRYRSRIREAKTLFEPLMVFRDHTLLEVHTLTGRMHQVRVHLASLGHPLVGDRLYQTSSFRKKDRLDLNRHFLHASRISFALPASKKPITLESALPPQLQKIIDDLESDRSA